MLDRLYKVAMISTEPAGKTTLANLLYYNRLIEAQPTIGVDFITYHYPSLNTKFQIWDVSSKDFYKTRLMRTYCKKASLFLVCIDLSSSKIDQSIPTKELLESFITDSPEGKVDFIVVGTKADASNDLVVKNRPLLQQLAKSLECPYVEVSATEDNINIQQLKQALENFVKQKIAEESTLTATSTELSPDSNGNFMSNLHLIAMLISVFMFCILALTVIIAIVTVGLAAFAMFPVVALLAVEASILLLSVVTAAISHCLTESPEADPLVEGKSMVSC